MRKAAPYIKHDKSPINKYSSLTKIANHTVVKVLVTTTTHPPTVKTNMASANQAALYDARRRNAEPPALALQNIVQGSNCEPNLHPSALPRSALVLTPSTLQSTKMRSTDCESGS